MASRKRLEPRIFFPWERRGGLLSLLLMRRRTRSVVLAGMGVALVVWIALAERQRTRVRETQATLRDVRAAVDAYLAEHDGGCPPDIALTGAFGPPSVVPVDAWGRPLRFRCPGWRPDVAYDLSSDGPDGIPGGLDRIE